jgi:uncharacterized protein (DUF1499 family)
MMQLLRALLLVLFIVLGDALTSHHLNKQQHQQHQQQQLPLQLPTLSVNRRQALSNWASVLLLITLPQQPANAFENKISTKYDDQPKRRGPTPRDLGISQRTLLDGDTYVGLNVCKPVSPNCFSSQDPDPEHSIPAWTWPQTLDQTAAWEQLLLVLRAYPPGQNGVDGGGFNIVAVQPNQYVYVQYESLKHGYIDDVEFAIVDDNDKAVQVRSSSRVGYLDFGVNAKRINWIAKALRDKGWDAVGVDFSQHAEYASQNNV